MNNISIKLTIQFSDSFWIGVFELRSNDKISVAKVTFGAEPKDYEILKYVLNNYERLQFSQEIESKEKENKMNPKRMQRNIKKQLQSVGIGTKAQQALKIQQEQKKQDRKITIKEQKLVESKYIFELKQQKKKDKHRGH